MRTCCVLLTWAALRERAAKALEAILEACRVVDRGRDKREVLVAHGQGSVPVSSRAAAWLSVVTAHAAMPLRARSASTSGTRSNTRRRRLRLWYSPLTANTISPSTSSELIRESMTCSSTSWRPWVRRTMRLSSSSARARLDSFEETDLERRRERRQHEPDARTTGSRVSRAPGPVTTSFRAPEAAPRRTTLSNDPLDDAVAVQRLQGFLGGDAADAEELRKLHLGRHAIPRTQPARPDLVQDVVVQLLVKERPLGCSRRS